MPVVHSGVTTTWTEWGTRVEMGVQLTVMELMPGTVETVTGPVIVESTWLV